MTLSEKVSELYDAIKQRCKDSGLCLAWEIHKELKRYRSEHPEDDKAWFG